MRLTENYAMYPNASVSGLYFANPQACYFDVKYIFRSINRLCKEKVNKKTLSKNGLARIFYKLSVIPSEFVTLFVLQH